MDVRKFADGKLPHERRAMPSRNRFEKKLCGTGSDEAGLISEHLEARYDPVQ
jgi:hypothetical protein